MTGLDITKRRFMILAVDIGNSSITIGGVSADKIEFIEHISTEKSRTALEYAVSIRSVLDLNNSSAVDIDGAIISSVVPQLTAVVKLAIEKLYKVNAMVVGPGLKTGLNIMIDDPAQLGSDLLVDSVAAMSEHKAPLIVIDMGTAMSFCVINSKNQYIGGMIAPGIRTSLDSLVSNTSLLQQIELEPPKNIIGRNTIDCMKSGIIYGYAGFIDGLIEQIELQLKSKCTIIATGGPAHAVIPYCKHEILIDNDLMIKGLKVIYCKNHKASMEN